MGKDTDLAELWREEDWVQRHSSENIHICTDTVFLAHMHVCAQSTGILIHMPSYPAML